MCWKCEDTRYHGPCDTEAEGQAYAKGKKEGRSVKHTKGPLKVVFNIPIAGEVIGHAIKTDDDVERLIATLWEGGGTKGKPTQIAYAHLFKAAPNMFEALECLVSAYKRAMGTYNITIDKEFTGSYRLATKAIHKAKGRP